MSFVRRYSLFVYAAYSKPLIATVLDFGLYPILYFTIRKANITSVWL